MLKISCVKNKNYSKKCFSIRHENSPRYSSCFITLFWKTFHIKYSSKFNYFYVAKQTRRSSEILDALSMCFITNIVQEKTKKELSSLVKLIEGEVEHSNDYIFRGRLDGEEVFIKVILSRLNADSPDIGVMQNEYEKGILASSECPYFIKPLYYIHFSKCEILISSFIQNIRTFNSIMQSDCPPPVYLREQIVETALYLKKKGLLHRDINGNNLVVGNLEGKEPQFFLVDCAFMTFLDSEGKIVPTPIENCIQRHARSQADEDRCFASILKQLDARLASDELKR